MIKHGFHPMLECSSKNPQQDKRFSAFYARLRCYGNKSIEEIYQAAKVFSDNSTNLSIKQAKGKLAINMEEVSTLYHALWVRYFEENPELLKYILENYQGFSDIFGQKNRNCQSTSVYRIWVEASLTKCYANQEKYSHLLANIGNKESYDIYCGRGRGSTLGNTYSHIPNVVGTLKVDTVEQAVAHFRFDFIQKWKNNPEFRQTILPLRGKVLGCFCKGKNICHCSVYLGAANVS